MKNREKKCREETNIESNSEREKRQRNGFGFFWHINFCQSHPSRVTIQTIPGGIRGGS